MFMDGHTRLDLIHEGVSATVILSQPPLLALLAILTVEYILCLWLVYHAAYDMVASGMIISVVPDSVL
jgi:hypothetical protein